jgi:hypothetical protein
MYRIQKILLNLDFGLFEDYLGQVQIAGNRLCIMIIAHPEQVVEARLRYNITSGDG